MSNGTEAGTKVALDLNPDGSSWPSQPYYRASDNALYFAGHDGFERKLRRFVLAP